MSETYKKMNHELTIGNVVFGPANVEAALAEVSVDLVDGVQVVAKGGQRFPVKKSANHRWMDWPSVAKARMVVEAALADDVQVIMVEAESHSGSTHLATTVVVDLLRAGTDVVFVVEDRFVAMEATRLCNKLGGGRGRLMVEREGSPSLKGRCGAVIVWHDVPAQHTRNRFGKVVIIDSKGWDHDIDPSMVRCSYKLAAPYVTYTPVTEQEAERMREREVSVDQWDRKRWSPPKDWNNPVRAAVNWVGATPGSPSNAWGLRERLTLTKVLEHLQRGEKRIVVAGDVATGKRDVGLGLAHIQAIAGRQVQYLNLDPVRLSPHEVQKFTQAMTREAQGARIPRLEDVDREDLEELREWTGRRSVCMREELASQLLVINAEDAPRSVIMAVMDIVPHSQVVVVRWETWQRAEAETWYGMPVVPMLWDPEYHLSVVSADGFDPTAGIEHSDKLNGG